MSKKNKNNMTNNAPELHHIDDIGYMSDDFLSDRIGRLESDRNRAISSGNDPMPWEVEIAYLQREQNFRKIHVAAHADYLQRTFVNNADSQEEELS